MTDYKSVVQPRGQDALFKKLLDFLNKHLHSLSTGGQTEPSNRVRREGRDSSLVISAVFPWCLSLVSFHEEE